MKITTEELRAFVSTLSDNDKSIIEAKKGCFNGSWDVMVGELLVVKQELQNEVVKDIIDEDVERIGVFRSFEKDNDVDLSGWIKNDSNT